VVAGRHGPYAPSGRLLVSGLGAWFGLVPRGGSLTPVLIVVLVAAVAVVTAAAVVLSRRERRRARRMPVSLHGDEGPGWSSSPRGGLEPALARAGEPEPDAPNPLQDLSNAARSESPTSDTAGAQGGVAQPEGDAEPRPRQPSPSGEASDAALLELLDDDRPSVRQNAVNALAIGRGAHAVRGLSYAISRDPSVEVRREAILGLRSLVEKPADSVGSPQMQGTGATGGN